MWFGIGPRSRRTALATSPLSGAAAISFGAVRRRPAVAGEVLGAGVDPSVEVGVSEVPCRAGLNESTAARAYDHPCSDLGSPPFSE